MSIKKTCPSHLGSIKRASKIAIGSGGISLSGWFATDLDSLDVVKRESFSRYWEPNSRHAFLAEHVWEHLTEAEAVKASANCHEFLRPGGRLRLAVPDGLHPDPSYREYVRPHGSGTGSEDHKLLYNYRTLKAQLEEAGFVVCLLEYWDEYGKFHFSYWRSEDGHIRRSRRYDPRNQNGSLSYTSLIIDGIKPISLAQRVAKLFRRV